MKVQVSGVGKSIDHAFADALKTDVAWELGDKALDQVNVEMYLTQRLRVSGLRASDCLLF